MASPVTADNDDAPHAPHAPHAPPAWALGLHASFMTPQSVMPLEGGWRQGRRETDGQAYYWHVAPDGSQSEPQFTAPQEAYATS